MARNPLGFNWVFVILPMLAYMALLASYYIIVPPNQIYTFKYLPPSAIPFFDSTGSSGHPSLHQMDRYSSWEWWMTALYNLRLVAMIMPLLFHIQLSENKSRASLLGYLIVMLILTAWELTVIIYRSWQYAYCYMNNVCVGYGGTSSRVQTQPNWIFRYMYFVAYAFFVLDIICMVLGWIMYRYSIGHVAKPRKKAGTPPSEQQEMLLYSPTTNVRSYE